MKSDYEIEVKIFDIDREQTHKKILANGGEHLGTVHQVDRVFGNGDTSFSVRVRTSSQGTIFTTKRLVARDQFKVREELEVAVNDGETFAKQLCVMGFHQLFLVEKERSTYRYQDVVVTIDQYPGIQPLMEIEGRKEDIEPAVASLGMSIENKVILDFKNYLSQIHHSTIILFHKKDADLRTRTHE